MYVKLFTSIYQGTLRGNSDGLLVFTNLLAHADRNGVADIHPRAISEETGISVERVKSAIDYLESPDEDSRTPDEEGRRLVRLDEHRAWGWLIVNYAKYREIRSEDDRRRQNREAQKRYRDKHSSASISTDKHSKPQSAHAEAEAEAEADTTPKGVVRATRLTKDWHPSDELFLWAKHQRPDLNIHETVDTFVDYWTAVSGKNAAKLDWDATFRNWVRKQNAQKAAQTGETAYQRAMRERVEEFSPSIARKAPGVLKPVSTVLDLEIQDVPAIDRR